MLGTSKLDMMFLRIRPLTLRQPEINRATTLRFIKIKRGDHAQIHQNLTTNDLVEVAMEQEASANSRLTQLAHLLRNGCQAVESMQLW